MSTSSLTHLANSDIQIKTAFEDESMTPEQIAEDMGYEVAAVKAKLMQVSASYRKGCSHEELDRSVLNFSLEESLQIKNALLEIGLYSEDEHVRTKVLLNLRDDSMGRKEVVKTVQTAPVNLQQFNTILMNSNAQAAQIMERNILPIPKKVIDVQHK